MKVYDCFNNNFLFDCNVTYLNIPHMPIDNSHTLKKIDIHTSDLLSNAIYISFKNSISTLKPHCESPLKNYTFSDTPVTYYIIMKD